jgi:hypothetical protein
MKTFSYDNCGGNTLYTWAYINGPTNGERYIWVAGHNEFTLCTRAVIDDFGNLVGVTA